MKSSALLEAASRLEVAERIELVEAIWETLRADPQSLPVPPDHLEELDCRLADIEANPDAGSSWAEVRERLERRGR
jgi:putative addiction module component (TIGR02574 family)